MRDSNHAILNTNIDTRQPKDAEAAKLLYDAIQLFTDLAIQGVSDVGTSVSIGEWIDRYYLYTNAKKQ